MDGGINGREDMVLANGLCQARFPSLFQNGFMDLGEVQGDAFLVNLFQEPCEYARRCEINLILRRKVQDDRAERCVPFVNHRFEPVACTQGIGVVEGRVNAHDQDARDRFTLRMPSKVCVSAGNAGHAPE